MVEIEQIVCGLREPIDLERLRAAWQWVVDRHEVLRTEFRWEDRDEPTQVIVVELAVRFEVVHHESLSPGEREAGCLINTLPVRVRVPPDAELCAWLRDIRAHNLAARPFEQASLTDIKSWSNWPSGAPLFETLRCRSTRRQCRP